METTTCTIVTTPTGGRCGKPAVTTFKGRTGVIYGECAEHAAPGTAEPTAVGTTVLVRHVGIVKTGRVIAATPTFLTVVVPIHAGKATKTIRVRRTELV